MKKKWVSLIALSLVLILAACGGSDTEDVDAEANAEGNEETNNEDAQENEEMNAENDNGAANDEANASAESITLSYAFFAPENTFPAVQMQKWAEELDARTETDVEVEMYFGGSLIDADNMFDGVRDGVADIGLTATSYFPGTFPLYEISDLPSGYPNSEVASQVFLNLVEEYPDETLDDFEIVTAFATEPSYIQSVDAIDSLDEMSGRQLRISGAIAPVLEALGAAPVGMDQAEAAEALQTGVVEGNVSSREVLMDFQFAEIVNYTTDYPLTVTSFVSVMNQDVYNELPADVHEALEELKWEMSAFAGSYLDEHVQEALQWSEEEHDFQTVELSAEEAAEWDGILENLQDEYVEAVDAEGLPGSEYRDRLYELIDEYSDSSQ